MDPRVNFVDFLDHEMTMKILMCLEHPSDLVRVSCVSRSWHHFVIANGLCKQLCLRMFPGLRCVDKVIEVEPSCGMKRPSEVGCSKLSEWETLKRENRAYAFLTEACTKFPVRDCISEAISASSTDHSYETILNTLEPRVGVGRKRSCWSSKGQRNPAVPETLLYKITAGISVITEINIQPFQEWDSHIYSARAVRFRMGHTKDPVANPLGEPCNNCADDEYVWTYTSPEFPMVLENRLQDFKLPEPVVCIGEFLWIDLLGRVQRHEMDGLFYICVSQVQAVGRSLSPAFDVEPLEQSGKFVLKVHGYKQPLERDSHREYIECRLRYLECLKLGLAAGDYLVYEEDDLSDEDI